MEFTFPARVAPEATQRVFPAHLIESLLASTSDAVFVKDRHGRYLLINEPGAALLGRTVAEVLGQDDTALLSSASAARRMATDLRVLRNATAETYEETLLVEGIARTYSLHSAPWTDAAGLVCGVIGTASDVTPRKLTEAALRESEGRFSQLFEQSPDAILLIDPHSEGERWPIVACNAAACQMNGYSRDQLIGQSIDILNEKPSVPGGRADYLAWLRADGVIHVESVHIAPDGRRLIIDSSSSLIQLGGRELVMGIDRDVTARKQLEEALQANEARFHLVARATSDVIWDWDLLNDTVWWNEGYERQFGYRRGDVEMRINSWYDHLHPDDAERVVDGIHAVIDGGGETWADEYRFQLANGAYANIWDRGYVEHDEGGRPLRMIGSMLDITARKQAEAALRVSEARYRSLLEISPDPILLTTLAGDILLANRQAARLCGVEDGTLVGCNAFDFVAAPNRGPLREALARVGAPESAQSIEYAVQRGNELVPVELSAAIVADDAGAPTGYLWVQRDITERRLAEVERVARLAAEKSNLAKSEFLSRMSHELRTPLNIILGFGQIMEMDATQPEQQESAELIVSAGRHLLGLIDEVLEITSIEQGRLAISLEAVEVGAVFDECRRLLTPLAEQHGVCLNSARAAYLSDQTTYVLADRQRLRQVLLNLLVNAIKYNRAGGQVTLTCDLARISAALPDAPQTIATPAQGDAEFLRIMISDTGIGIAPEKMDRLFTPFDRMGAEQSNTEGTGLGLAISRALTEAMGGRIGATSVLDQGSTFWLEFRHAEPPGAPSANEPE